MADLETDESLREDPRELVFYDPRVTFPLITGATAFLGGVDLALGGAHRSSALEVAYFLAIGLIVGAAIAYLILGMWLLPASMAVGGLVLFSAHQGLIYLPGWASILAVPYLIGGSVGMLEGLIHVRGRPSLAE